MLVRLQGMGLTRRSVLVTTFAAGLSARAGAQDATVPLLRIGAAAAVTSADPLFYNYTPNINLAAHVFERLVDRDPQARPRPGLAVSWDMVTPTEWEFRLRPGVLWHDGSPFTADDVAFTIARVPNVPNSPGSYAAFVRSITAVRVVDPLTLRLETRRPNPLLPRELGSIAIVSRHVGEGASTADYNGGRAAIGTGPYRLASFSPNEGAELVRNDAYWGGRAPWARVTYRTVPNDAARVAALLSGDVDVIDQVPPADVARLGQDQRVVVSSIASFRSIYLALDFSHEGDAPFVTAIDGTALGRNPLRDLRVRRALSLAIGRAALTDRVMEGGAVANGQWLPQGAYSHDPTMPVPAQDVAEARRLLSEAGYPNGFRITLFGPNDRYPGDARVVQAIGQMWTRAGVQTQVEVMPWSRYVTRSARQEFPIWLLGWGNSTGEATSALLNVVGSYDPANGRGGSNAGRYANPGLDALTDRATATSDDGEREALLRQAVRTAMDDVAIIPLFQLTATWAMRKGLAHVPRMDERTAAVDVIPAS